MPQHTVGIFPASGGIGGGTVKHILSRLPAKDLVFIARSPEKLADEEALGVTVRKADYDDGATLETAFDGIETLFLISYASVEHHHRTERHRAAIDAALKSGVKYIFYGSLGFGGPPSSQSSVAHVMAAHLDTEKYLEQLSWAVPGFGYTVIREGLYSESYPLYTSFFNPNHPLPEIKIPHDGGGPGIAWVKREELGEGTAELIRRFIENPDVFKYRNSRVLLSGQQTLTLAETVEILGRIAGATVSIREVSNEEYAALPENVEGFTYKGVSYAYPWITSFEAFRRGEGSCVSPLLRELLGREPEDFETTIRRL
ncbi:hypothetical protein MBLNU13_g06318t2 [Cladosporium sp. NU13]